MDYKIIISRKAVSPIIATIMLISLAVAGSALYYVAVTQYFRPQAGMSTQVSMSVGASGFAIIDAQVIDSGSIPFTSVTLTNLGPSSSQLQISYSPAQPISGNGGGATIQVRGLSSGPYSAVSSSTTVSGYLVASTGSSYAVVVKGTTPNGDTYSQPLSIEATP